jgi:hypothetical protein
MDHAWVPSPGTDRGLLALQKAMRNRPNTTVQIPPARTVKEFFDALHAASSSSVPKPVGGLLVGTHANNDGWFEARFSPKQTRATEYDEVIRVVASDAFAFRIPLSLVIGANPPVKVRIVGCQAGKAPEMLAVLKRVFGNAPPVVGSKFFYEALDYSGHGAFVSFRYGFEAYSPKEVKRRADLIALFTARAQAFPSDFQFMDGSPVPASQWTKWLPARGFSKTRQRFGPSHGKLAQKIGKVRTLPSIQLEMRHTVRYVGHIVPNMTAPATLAAGRAELKQKLPGLPEFAANHEFRFFRRKGNPTLADYVDTFDWKFQQNGTSTNCSGSRHDYSVLVPVKHIPSGATWEAQRLMYHFYPDPGVQHVLFTGDFNEDQPNIFVTV